MVLMGHDTMLHLCLYVPLLGDEFLFCLCINSLSRLSCLLVYACASCSIFHRDMLSVCSIVSTSMNDWHPTPCLGERVCHCCLHFTTCIHMTISVLPSTLTALLPLTHTHGRFQHLPTWPFFTVPDSTPSRGPGIEKTKRSGIHFLFSLSKCFTSWQRALLAPGPPMIPHTSSPRT